MPVYSNRSPVLHILPDPTLNVLHLRGLIPLISGELGEPFCELLEALAVGLVGEEILIVEEALVNGENGGVGGAVRSGVEAGKDLLEGFKSAGNKCSSGSRSVSVECGI